MGVVAVHAFHVPGGTPDIFRGIMDALLGPDAVLAYFTQDNGPDICSHIAVMTDKTDILFPYIVEQAFFSRGTVAVVAIEARIVRYVTVRRIGPWVPPVSIPGFGG